MKELSCNQPSSQEFLGHIPLPHQSAHRIRLLLTCRSGIWDKGQCNPRLRLKYTIDEAQNPSSKIAVDQPSPISLSLVPFPSATCPSGMIRSNYSTDPLALSATVHAVHKNHCISSLPGSGVLCTHPSSGNTTGASRSLPAYVGAGNTIPHLSVVLQHPYSLPHFEALAAWVLRLGIFFTDGA